MEVLQIILLAVIQGISEFLPISSSAHLIIFRDIFGLASNMSNDVALLFDIALHFGTLLAIILYFFKDFLQMFIKGITKGIRDKEGKIFWYLVVATIPAAVAGVLLEDIIENAIRNNYILIALALMIMGIIIYLVDKKTKQEKEITDMTLKDAIIIGCSQVFALIPGFSRSGTTIAAGRSRNIKREDAAKFSFYLSAPVVLGAVVLQVIKGENITLIQENISMFVIGVLVAFIAGLLCIEFLLKYLKKHDFKLFMWYRIVLAIVVIIFVILKP